MICPLCDKPTIWQNDFDAIDCGFDDTDGIVSFWYCSDCDELHEYLIADNETFLIVYDANNGEVHLMP